MIDKKSRATGLALFFLLVASGVAAQTPQRCKIDGQWVYSDRPCPRPEVGSFGALSPAPTRTPQVPSQQLPTTARAPEWLNLMGSRCASLHDALRTASLRGLGQAMRAELKNSYDSECREQEDQARRRLHESQSSQQSSRQNAEEEAQARLLRERTRCEGLRDVIRSRSKQAEQKPDAGLEQSRALYARECKALER